MKKSIILIAFVLLAIVPAFAQKEVVGKPYSFTHNNISQNVDRIELPVQDHQKLINEDAINFVKDGKPMRVGVSEIVKLNTKNSGRTDILPNGDRLWRVTVKSPDALMLCAYISNFNIPEEASFYIYSGDFSQLTGKYTAEAHQQRKRRVNPSLDPPS